ncbi:hypothetical protein M0805_002079 [Coniferiporia weirii]|nr:hypothetical protein M0805_002079 [Coniferiporia weirii]
MIVPPTNLSTLVHRLIDVSTSVETSSAASIECCGDVLSYRQLLILSCKLAESLHHQFGEKPTVAIISENHPYVLAVIIATWILGGTAAPLDHHAPELLLRGMLQGVQPTCIVLPEDSTVNLALAKDMGLSTYVYSPSNSRIPQLLRRFSVENLELLVFRENQLPKPSDDALYLYTSSASSVSNLKCVPITHGALYANCNAKSAAFHSEHPSAKGLRTLGWGPFSHIMALAHDFGTNTILAAGCYVFGIPPSSYPNSKAHVDVHAYSGRRQVHSISAILLRTAARTETNLFSGVPWILRQFMEVCASRPEYNFVLRNFYQIHSGGAKLDDDVVEWATTNRLQLDVGIGMTELAGSLFQARITDMVDGGVPISSCMIAEANLSLIDDKGVESQSFGELVISSKNISKGYLNFDSDAYSINSVGVTTFRTGDMYRLSHGYLAWQGRREDYIQLLSGELLDPRQPERELSLSPYIARACLVGNNFLRGAADFVCAVIEVPDAGFRPKLVMRAFAEVNKTLHPPLRVPWARVLVLEDGEKVPVTRKGLIWRKVLEDRFGERFRAILENPNLSRFHEKEKSDLRSDTRSTEGVEASLKDIVANVLGLSEEQMSDNVGMTFAELGMDSNMAIRIISTLNYRFHLDLPMSACHDYTNVIQLAKAVFTMLTSHSEVPRVKPLALESPTVPSADVAIIGHSLRLPGGINDAESFWAALVERREDLLTTITDDRWVHSSFYVPPGSEALAGSYNFTKTGRIEVASYDNAFFGISPAEAYFVSPSSRIVLELAIEALENANIPLSAIKGKKVGVFVAVGPQSGYSELIFEDKGYEGYGRHYGVGLSDSTVSGRLSYFLDVHGPSISLDTACSGGMVAFDNAVRSIRDGSSELAIVCSVSVHLWPGNFSFLSSNKMSSISGRCAAFTKDADGYAPSEGAVAFVLKGKSSATRDNDNILGIVKSTSVQHNGRSQGLAAPNARAQANLQRTLISDAGVSVADIDFVETHGTGTILGDMLEIQALREVFAGSHDADSPLILGAAKTVFGHTESAAGLVGIAKAIHSFRHELVPGLAHLNGDNRSTSLDSSSCPLRVSCYSTLLHRQVAGDSLSPYRSLVLAYGFAGTISGAVLEEYRLEDASNPVRAYTKQNNHGSMPVLAHLFVVSAKTEKALLEYLRVYTTFCQNADEGDLVNICYTACVGREHYQFRFACSCTSLKDLVSQIEETLSLATKKPISAIASKPRIAFAFPGQGSQWQGMGRALADIDKRFCDYLMDYARQAGELLHIDLMPLLFEIKTLDDKDKTSAINETHLSQACIFVFQCAMVQWLGSIGIRPSAILAHSLGEIAAAVVTGVMNFSTALEFVIVRANAMRPERTDGGLMAALRAPAEQIERQIATLDLSMTVTVAAYNSDTQHVVSGDAQSVHRLVDDLAAKSIKGTILPVNQGFHSQCIDAALVPIRGCLDRLGDSIGTPNIAYYSSVEGRALKTDERLSVDYWVKQARQPVRFSNAAREFLTESKCQVVLDVGPQNVIAHLLRDAITRTPSNMAISSVCDRPVTNSLSPLMQSMATLFVLGATPNFEEFYAGRRVGLKKTAIPTYPWQKLRYYPTIIPSRTGSSRGSCEDHTYSKAWDIGKELGPLLEKGHTLNGAPIVPAAALAMFVSLETRKRWSGGIDLRILKPIFLEPLGQDVLRLDINGSSFTCTHLRNTTGKEIVCSGTLRTVSPISSVFTPTSAVGSKPSIAKDEIYRNLGTSHVNFGPDFQNIRNVDFLDSSAVGKIDVLPSGQDQADFVRKLDACIHLLGSIALDLPLELSRTGAFLPSSLGDFRLYADSLPDSFKCIYQLPIRVASNFRKLTATFEVRSLTGNLLAFCGEYSVAWIPSDLPQISRGAPRNSISLMETIWLETPLEPLAKSPVLHVPTEVIYVGAGIIKEAFKTYAKYNSLTFRIVDDFYSFFGNMDCKVCSNTSSSSGSSHHGQWCPKLEIVYYIVFDTTSFSETDVTESGIASTSAAALDFVRAVAPHLHRSKIASMIVLTQNALQILPRAGLPLANPVGSVVSPNYLLGSFIQGMVRVLRQETVSELISVLDIPDGILTSEICALVYRELNNPGRGKTSPTACRYSKNGRLIRLEPRLVEDNYSTQMLKKSRPPPDVRKCAIIVGMGDIGVALARQMVKENWSVIVFVGRRAEKDKEVVATLASFHSEDTDVRYMQADAGSYSSIRSVLARTKDEVGPIYSIVHAAGVVKDSLIGSTSHEDLDTVLKPKALGAWNIHLACQDLGIDVNRFIMLSSISVPLGNPGQISYVAANSFLDALAGYRTVTATPGSTSRSLSIQLGAWESRLTTDLRRDDVDSAVLNISHAEGIPLLLKIIERGGDGDHPPTVVPILAKVHFELLRGRGTYASDPYFSEVLKSDSSQPSASVLTSLDISYTSVLEFVCNQLQEILGMAPSDENVVDSSTLLLSLGVDSISFAQLRADIFRKFKVDLPMSFLGEDALTLGDVTDYIIGKL